MDYTTRKEEPKKKVKPIVDANRVVSSKESMLKKVAKSFFADDIRDIKSYLLWDKIIPGAKNLILDGLEKMFFNEVRGSRSRGRTGYDYDKSSYQYYYNGRSSSSRSERPKREEKVDCRNVVLQYREDAERLVQTMRQYIREDGEVTIATLFELIDCPGDYIDNNWGWDDERDIGFKRISNGYLIDVREPKYLGK